MIYYCCQFIFNEISFSSTPTLASPSILYPKQNICLTVSFYFLSPCSSPISFSVLFVLLILPRKHLSSLLACTASVSAGLYPNIHIVYKCSYNRTKTYQYCTLSDIHHSSEVTPIICSLLIPLFLYMLLTVVYRICVKSALLRKLTGTSTETQTS